MIRLTHSLGSLSCISVLLACPAAARACPCNGDVNNNGIVNAVDAAIVADCASGVSCAQCVNDCDVDCNQIVDFVDFGVVWCHHIGGSNCCHQASGACTPGNQEDYGACVITYEPACVTAMAGPGGSPPSVFHGSDMSCVDDEPAPVPAASTWGLLIILIAVLVAGTLAINRQRETA